MTDLAGPGGVGPTAGSIGSAAEVAASDFPSARPLRADIWKRFRRNKLALVGLTFIVLLILVAIFASVIAPYSITERTSEFRQPPSADHWFGTDRIGRDVFSRVVFGARVSLRVGILATVMSLVIGVIAGAVAGFLGGATETVIMRLTDIFLAIPYIILAIALATVLGRGENTVIVVLGVTGWLAICRLVRSSFLSLKRLEYVEAATAVGAGRLRIMFRHILPNALQPIIVYGTIAVGSAILAEAALSFLGVGAVEPTPAWGLMVDEGRGDLVNAPHLLYFPGGAIFLTVLAFQFVGDGLRDALDPEAAVTEPETEVVGDYFLPEPRVLLSVRDLHTTFKTDHGDVRAVDGVSFDIHRGEVFAVVGESGSGKSVTAMSILGLLPSPPAHIEAEGVMWKGRDLLQCNEDTMRHIRGAEIAIIFQDPLTALNPVHTVGKQIAEMARIHDGLGRKAARLRAIEMLGLVGIPQPARRVDDHPHEFSGGMRQRVMIAMAITCNPDLLIADEPTTALDVTVQAQVLEVLLKIKDEIDSAILLITHDLGVVAGTADRVMVMYAGRQAELGVVDEIFGRTRHPYTLGLLASLPRLDDTGEEKLLPIRGQPPSLLNRPPGCPFHPRCPFARELCAEEIPAFRVVDGTDHRSACHYAEELEQVGVQELRAEETEEAPA